MVYIPAALRAALIGGSLLVLVFIIYSSVKASMDVHYAVLWITMAALILLIGLWPELAGAVADWIGFQSVSNFVFTLAHTHLTYIPTRAGGWIRAERQ